MSYVRTKIHADELTTPDIDLYLPHGVLKSGKSSTTHLTVQFGKISTYANVKSTTRSTTTQMRPSLQNRLRLPTGVPMLVRYDASRNSIVFGPLVGILLTTIHTSYSEQPFGILTPFLNELADTSYKRGGVICAFTLDDVDWEKETVQGMIRRNGSWQKYTLPLPLCIYNRLASRHVERSEKVSAWIDRCKQLGIPFFNEHFLNKWHVHKALLDQPEAIAYLPKTICYSGLTELKQMFQEHRTIYAKPTNGSMGKGIFQLSRTVNSYYLKSAMLQGTRTYKDASSLHASLVKRMGNKPYILQQGLSLIGLGKRTTDFRVLVQKNRKGEWDTTSLVARTGQNSVVSNVARGGTMMRADLALYHCGPWVGGVRPSASTLKNVALKLARVLEQAFPGHYAELGIDLGIDIHGRIWLLEVNSKPSKALNTLQIQEGEEAPTKARPSVRRLFDYATFLNGFVHTSNKNTKKQVRRKVNRR